MRWKKPALAVAILSVLIGGCVLQSDFDEFKAEIKQDGEAVDTWIAQVHEWIMWLDANKSQWCGESSCDTTPPPPSPPPDGCWCGSDC